MEQVSERRRRLTWWVHNILVTPFIPVRMLFLIVIKVGELAEKVGMDLLPGWRRYDGWSGW